MSKRITLLLFAGVLAATFPAGCRDSASPERRGPLAPQFDAAAAPNVALDQATGLAGLAGTSGTTLGQGFSPNPHNGDAIVATFFWRGSTNIVTSVTDRLADGTPVGNSYTLVEYVQAGGVSMATYVATNVQNVPDPNADWNDQLEVLAYLSAAVTDGGVVLSAFTGVNAVSATALGAHRSASGSGSSETTARPGAISANAGTLVYGVTMSNDGVAGLGQPPGFATTFMVSDAEMSAEGDYAVQVSAGSVDPEWTWYFNAPSTPRTWLATVLALNTAPPQSVATRLAFTVQPSGTTRGTTIAPAVKVAALDEAGNTVSSYSGSITVRPIPGPGTLAGTTTVAAVNGVATFSDLSIDKAGNAYRLQATAAGLTGATSTAFDIAPRTEVQAAAANGIALDQQNGALLNSPSTFIRKGFNPTNPRLGSTIIATFYWLGSTNIIPTVFDHLADGTPVGNTYRLVANVTADNIAMATFVATNVQNYPEGTFPSGEKILVVEGTFPAEITDGGILISSYTGVDPVFDQAFGGFASASGSGSTPTVAHPGPIRVNAGALAYGVTMANRIVGLIQPADFTPLNNGPMSNDFIKTDGVFAVQASAGFVDPQWTWFFDQAPNPPGTWLASGIALNPPATTGNLMVSNTTTGSSFPNSYTVTVDAGTPSATSQPMAPNGNTTFTGLPAGNHSVTLTVASNCTVTSTNPVSVNVPAGGTVNTSFTVSCTTPPGNLTVSNTTTGSSFPNSYTVTVDAGTPSATSRTMAPNGSTTFTGLPAGNHSVTLTVASNCTVTSTNPVSVNVPAGGTANTSFTVSCTTPQVRVQVSGGGRIDPSSGKTTFGFNVDGRSGSPIQGEMQVVYHGGTSRMTRIHSSSIDGMTTSSDPRGGVCVTWTGSARVDNGAQRRFTATACDNGEPGSSPGAGPDRFGITVDGAISIGLTDLRGGNIQARQ